jgi:hypothetical protein
MTANPGPEGLEMRGGSQAKMRFLGGAMTKDSILPRRGVLKRSPESEQVNVERITLHLEDRMGFGLMDPGMRRSTTGSSEPSRSVSNPSYAST